MDTASASNSEETIESLPRKTRDSKRKEGDEEQWISGEELNTDGSSDEGGKKGVRRKQKRDNKGARPKDKSSLRSIDDTIPKPKLAAPVLPDSDSEEPIDISWKPKRGSIKLPHMVKDLEATSCSTSNATKPSI